MPVLSSPKTTEVLRSDKGKLPSYPANHQVGMKVPKGGSSCSKCEYVSGERCRQEKWVRWHGGNLIPEPTDSYCCDFFEAKG